MVSIDFFELTVLIEASWDGGTILRHSIMEKAINKWFHAMTPDDQKRIHEIFNRIKIAETPLQKQFLARFDPDNQYAIIVTDFKNRRNARVAYLYDGLYYVDTRSYLSPENKVEVKKL